MVTASATDPLTALDYRVSGARLTISPAALAVPKNIAGSVGTQLSGPAPAGSFVEAFLRGPSFPARRLVGAPGQPLLLPPLNLVGDYSLDGIRLADGATNETLLDATPPTVPVQVFDEILVSRVTSRPLSLAEIEERGIVIDESNFRAVEFEVGFVLDGEVFPVRFPVVAPQFRQTTEIIPAAELEARLAEVDRINDALAESVPLPPELEVARPNVQIRGINIQLTGGFKEDLALKIPPIPALMVIPGSIGYLNQFFSVQIFTENAAPAASGLSVHDIKAELLLPTGPDRVAGTFAEPGDDPVRFARVGPSAEIRNIIAIQAAGPDGEIGTPDDIPRLQPGQGGQGEFLVEGLQEGLHVLELKLTAKMDGLAAGTVEVEGKAAGSVLVSNPSFSMAFSHPRTVRAGEPYDAFVTLLNTSNTIANLPSISLNRLNVSGAQLISDERVEFRTLAPGETVTARFRFLAQRTGAISFSNITTSDDSLVGRFRLTTGVDERGVTLSRNTLTLPDHVNALPPEVVAAANRVLGQALSASTAPLLPPGVLRVPRSLISTGRVTTEDGKSFNVGGGSMPLQLAEAGQRVRYGEPLSRVLPDLLLDWQGGRQFAPGWDQIIRSTEAGREWREAVMRAMEDADPAPDDPVSRLTFRAADLAGRGESWWFAAVSRGTFQDNGGTLTPDGSELNLIQSGGSRAGIDTSDVVQGAGYGGRDGAWLVSATPGTIQWKFGAALPGPTKFSILEVRPDGTARALEWTAIDLPAGACALFDLMGTTTDLGLDDTCDGTTDRSVAGVATDFVEVAPQALVVRQDPELLVGRPERTCYNPTTTNDEGERVPIRNYGNIVAVLFNKPMTQESAGLATAYTLDDGTEVAFAQVQPGGRVALLTLRRPMGALVPRSLRIGQGVTDLRGNRFPGADVPVQTRLVEGLSVRGRVVRADGTGASNLPVTLTMNDGVPGPNGCMQVDVRIAQAFSDADGNFSFPFVVSGIPFSLSTTDVSTVRDNQAIALILESSRDGVVTAERLEALAASLGASQSETQSTLRRAFGVQNFSQAIALAEGLDRAVVRDFPPESRQGGEGVYVLTFRGRGTVTGTVLEADGVTPAVGAAVNLFPDPDSRELGRGILTDGAGRFTFFGVPLGGMSVEVATVAGRSRSVSALLAEAGETLDLSILVGATIVPRTTLQGRVTEPDGTPHGGANVYVRATAGAEVTGPTLSQSVTDADGFWSAQDVLVGTVSVIAISRDGRRKGERSNIAAVENAINTVNVTLQARATVRGRVEFANGDPVAGAIVGGGEALVTTDAQGGFVVEGVPTGRSSVSAGLAADPQSPDPRRRFARLGSANLTVLPGDDNFAVIRFSPAGRIAGQVLNEAGAPVPNINVAIPIYIDELSGSFMWVRADGSGLFSFDNLGLGSYDLSAPAPPVEEFDPARALAQIREGDLKQIEAAVKAAFAAFSGASDPFLNGEGDSFNPNNWGFIRDVRLSFDGETVITPVRFLPKASISGVVKNGQGVPIGARVRLTGLGPKPNGEPTMRIKSDIDSDPALGTFSFPNGTFVGDWGLQAANPLFPVVVSTSGRTTQIDPVVTGVVLQFPAVQETNGSLSGQVLNPDGSPAGPDLRVHIDLSNDFFIRTDADGRFATTQGTFTLPARGYTVTALDEITGATGRASAEVRAGQDNAVTVTLLGRGTASVEVRLADGSPAAGATTEIEMNGFPGGRFEGTTNAAGRIEFSNVFEGAYTACASLTVGGTRVAGRTSIQVPRDGLGGGVITLGGTATVRGQFVRIDGRTPISFANANLAGLAVSPTDADGRFTLLDVPLGTHRLTVTDPASGRSGFTMVVLTTPNEIREVLVVEIALGTVFGLVTNGLGIAPVPNAEIVLTLDDPFAVNRRRTVTTAPDGTYSFAAVPAGNFELTARDPVTSLRGGARATLSPSTGSLEVNLPLQATAHVTILVLEPDGVTPADATVRLGAGTNGLFADTGLDGRARFENIVVLTGNSGPYNVTAASRRTGETRSVASGSINPRVRGAEEVATLILLGVGTVEGQVLQANGLTPAPGAEVHLQMPTGGTETVVATAQGLFQFTNVPVGQSSLSAFSQALGAQSPVTVPAPGATVTQNLVLTASGTVIGRLLRADGTTAAEGADVVITFRSASNADGTFTARLGADGRFSFAPITVGPFSIAASQPTVNGLARASGTIASNGDVVDVGDIRLDEAPPVVVASLPGPGDDGIDINATIEVLFNEALDPATVDPTGVFLRKATGGPAVPATVTLVSPPTESARRLVLIDPSAPLESETAYQVLAVDGDLRDAFGGIINRGPRDLVGRALVTLYSATFTTRDQRPPVLLSFTPENGAEQVDGRATIRLSVDEPIQAGAVVTLTGPTGPVAGTTTLGVNSLVLTFVPAAPLPPNASFTITVDGVQDLAGNAMVDQPLSRTFSTLDTLGPVVTELRLKDNPAPLANTPVTLQAVLAAAEPGVRVRFSADAVTLATTDVGILELPVTLPSTGAVTYRALAIDRFGNEGPLAELRVTIQENQPPVIAFEKLIPATGPSVLSGSAAQIRVTVIDDGNIATFRAAGTGGWTAPLQTNTTGAPIVLSAVVPPTAIPGSTIAVLASATDTAGLSSGERRFELPVADGTAPSLTLVSPAANALLDPDVPLALEFDIADNSGTATVEIALSGAVTDSRTIETTGAPNTPQRRTVEFDISAAPRTGASLSATARATDAAGRTSTVTRLFVVPDLVPPALEFLNPPDGSSEAAITSNVVARFSEPLDPTTVNGDSVRLDTGGTPVPGTVTLTGGGRDVSFFPSQALTLDTTYTVTLTGGIRGTDGNPISPVTSTFTVTTGFGITAPAPGTRVIEGQTIPFAAGPVTAGFEGVVYSAAGRDLAGGIAPTFGASVTIPSLADLGAPPHLFGGRAFIDDLTGSNLALGQPTAQSSTGFGGPPQLAVDGNRNGSFSSSSVTHTNNNLHAWWEVDLGEVRDISLVRIFWRTDCCAERNRVAVLAAETPFNNADFTAAQLPATYSNGAREIYRTTAAFDQNRTSIVTASRARFIRIAHLATNFLSLAEVEVIDSIQGNLTLSPIVLDVRPASGDDDGDGMANGAEIAAGLNPFVNDSALDPDGDGLTNADEVAAGTSPFRSDTDGDGLSDPQELTLGTSPILADTDGDGLRDGLEGTFGTSPLLADTDGDGLSDGFELGLGRVSFINDAARSWRAARDDAIARGGHLLTLTSAAENAAFIALFGADPRAPSAWIGHTDRFIEGAFRPVTGEVTTFTHFGPGEPNNALGNEHAVLLRTDLAWNDANESSELAAYVLEVGFFTNPLLADSDGDGTPDAGDTFPNQPNQAVVASVDAFSTTAEAERFIAVADLLANDTDPEGDPFDLIAIGQPANGSAVFESAGTRIRYTPPPAFSGVDTFSYTVIEAGGLVSQGLVTIAVGSNRRPLAGAFQRDGFALDFDGANDFLQIAASAALALPAYPSWTIEAWVRPASVTNVQFPTLYSVGTWRASLGFRSTNGRLDSWINNTGEVNSTVSPTLGDWTHVALVFDGSTRQFVVNGVPAGEFASARPTTDGQPTRLGAAGGATPDGRSFFRGIMDDVRVWGTARTADDIDASRFAPLTGGEPGLVAYWALDEGEGAVAGDAIGQATASLGNNTTAAFPTWVPSTSPLFNARQDFGVLADRATPLVLSGSDPDGNALTARIVSLPSRARLFQVATGGGPGAEITTVPATLTSSSRTVFYQPDAGFAGSDGFAFLMHDGLDESAPAWAMISVSPAITPRTNDLWDVSAGATVTSSSGFRAEAPAANLLGAGGGIEPGTAHFADGQAAGFTHFVEWQTPGFVRLEGARLFAADDPATGQRGFTEMRLFGRLDAESEFAPLATFRPGAHPYFAGPELQTSLVFPPTVASQFRAEFDQFGAPGSGGPRVVELDAIGEPIILTPVNNGTPIPLQQATASGTQGGFSPGATIDGNLASGSGWAGDLGGFTPAVTAVYEAVSDVQAAPNDEFLFNLIQSFGGGHFIGNFRLSATTDPRSAFADGLATGGDVTANWTALEVTAIATTGGETVTQLPDGSVLIGGAVPAGTTYTVRAKGVSGAVTGFRLELLEHPSLPTNGPGRAGNGNWVLNEFTVAKATSIPNRAPRSLPDAAQTPQGFAVTTGNVLTNDFDLEGDPLALFDFTQPAAGTGSVVSNGDGTFSYTPPNPAFTGDATFTYRATDGFQPGQPATVTITVNPTAVVAWNNPAGGAWTTASNWTPARVPGPEDIAVIQLPGIYTVTLSSGTQTPLTLTVGGEGAAVTLRQSAGTLAPAQASVVAPGSAYELIGGTLAGTGEFAIQGTFLWTDGSMRDAGKTLIASGATATISGGGNKDLSVNRVLENAGTLTASGGVVFFNISNFGGGAGINNLAGGVFEVQGETDFLNNFASSTSVFNNAGLFRKTGGGVTRFSSNRIALNNSGTVEIVNGTLQLEGGGTHSGTITSATAGTLNLAGNTFTATDSATTTLNGALTVSGGTASFAGPVTALGTIMAESGSLVFTGPLTNGDALVIGSGSITFNQNQSFATFTQTGGTLGGTGTLAVTESFSWTGGSMRDAGKTLIAAGATGTISGGGNKDLSVDRVLENAGTLTASGGVIFFNINNLGGGAVINNLAGGVFEVQGETDFLNNFASPTSAFNNNGLFRKTGGGVTRFSSNRVAFNNTGTVEIVSGTLQIEGGGSHLGTLTSEPSGALIIEGGAFISDPTAIVTLNGNLTATGGSATFAGPVSALGTIAAAGGTLAFNGPLTNGEALTVSNGSIAFNQSQTFNSFSQSGGTLGGTGTITVTGTFSWTGGTMRDAGKTLIAAGATGTISGGGNKDLSVDRILENAGTLTASGGVIFFNISNFGGGAVINNLAGAIFEVQGETDFLNNFASPTSAFNNNGLFRKTGGGVTRFSSNRVAFNNTGTVEIINGSLQLEGGGSLGGLVDVQTGGTLTLDGGAFVLPEGGTLGGPGTLALTGGSATFSAPLIAGTSLSISNGTWAFQADQTFANLTLSNGTLAGTATVTVTNSFSWTGGGMRDAGKTLIAAGATGTISGGANKDLSVDRILENAGSLTASGGVIFFNLSNFGGGAVINNLADAVFEVQGETDFLNNFASPTSAFNNNGLFRKTGGGVTRFSSNRIAFNNTGTVEIVSGSLQLEGGGSLGGLVDVQTGGTLTLDGGAYILPEDGTLGGPGTLALTGGSATFSAPLIAGTSLSVSNGTWAFEADQTFTNLTISNGTLAGTATVTVTNGFSWTGGSMRDAGKTILGADAVSTISGNANKDLSLNRILENAGSLTVSGGTVFFNIGNLGGGAVIRNLFGGTLEIQGETDFTHNFVSPGSAVENAGTLRKSGGGETRFSSNAIALINTGTIELVSGSLRPEAGFSQNGLVRGSGTLVGNITNNGVFQPDPVPGGIVVQGTYTQTANGQLDLRLAAADPLLQHRGLRVTGAATLAGALDIALEFPFAESLAANFPVLSFASRAGDFTAVTGLADNFGYTFSRAFSPTSLDLTVTTQGDVPPPPDLLGLARATDFPDWMAAHAESAAASTSRLGPHDDADADGASNFVEYAFGTSPFDPASRLLPVPGVIADREYTWATLEFRRRRHAPNLVYEVLESKDMVHWSPALDTMILAIDPVPDQPDLESVRLVVWPALVRHEPCFLSLRVRSAAP